MCGKAAVSTYNFMGKIKNFRSAEHHTIKCQEISKKTPGLSEPGILVERIGEIQKSEWYCVALIQNHLKFLSKNVPIILSRMVDKKI